VTPTVPDHDPLPGSPDDGHRFGASDAHDSAGHPWSGRVFQPNPHAADDGRPDPALAAALTAFGAGSGTAAAVVDAIRTARLLAPLVAEAGTIVRTASGRLVDKSQELSLVTVAGPDGRPVLPAFTDVEAMRAWDPAARPVPVEGQRLALAAASEGSPVVLNAGGTDEFVLRPTALVAVATERAWRPPHEDPAVQQAFAASFAAEDAVRAIELRPGDPEARLAGPELVVVLSLVEGLDRAALDAVIGRLSTAWAASPAIADGVDSLTIRLVSAA